MERPDPESPGPFRLSADGALERGSRAAGLEVDVVEDVPMTWTARSLDAWWEISRDMSRMLAMLLQRLTPDEVEAVREGAERRLEHYVRPDGSLSVPEPGARRARESGLGREAMARAGLEPATPRFSAVCSTS